MEALDTALQYQEDQHFDAHVVRRWWLHEMRGRELETFRYHLSECGECRAFIDRLLKEKGPTALCTAGPNNNGQ